ncbi:MAG TPA: hypothetical protein VE544_02870 [Nitrososphaeraceae archaeon]|nr:hypothetical protein [Nitrososphaeraceae archaeon]
MTITSHITSDLNSKKAQKREITNIARFNITEADASSCGTHLDE